MRKKPRRLKKKRVLEIDRPSPEEDPLGARGRRLLFVAEYKKTGDLVTAAMNARISRGEAQEIIECNPELREDVISLLNRIGATPERIVREMARVAFSDPRTMLDAKTGVPLPMREWPDDLAHAVSGMDVTKKIFRGDDYEEEEITYKPRLWDKNVQLRELARMQQIAGAETQRVGNVPGERLRTDDGGNSETREQIMLSLLALVSHKKDPEDK